MFERHRPHAGQSRSENKRTRWGRILLPLTTIAFLVSFIIAMLVIYVLAD